MSSSLIRESEYLHLHDRLSLQDLVHRYPGRRGVGRLRAALHRLESAPPGRVRVGLEERFAAFLRRHGLPQPRFNDWILVAGRRFLVDCHWRGCGQVVELDSWEAHASRSAFREDRERDRALRVAGYSVTRLTWAQLDDEPEAVAEDIRQLISGQPGKDQNTFVRDNVRSR